MRFFGFSGDLPTHASFEDSSFELEVLDAIAEIVELCFVANDIGKHAEHGGDGDSRSDCERKEHHRAKACHVTLIGYLYENLW